MKNKFIALLMILATIIILPCMAEATESGKCGDDLTWTLDDNGTLVISGTGEMWDYSADDNQSPWCMSDKVIKNVIFSNGITSIGDYSFFGCTELTNLSFSDGITRIGASAFDWCTSLENCILPNSLEIIGDRAFRTCQSLKKIVLPDSVTQLGEYAFYASGLEEITLCKNIKAINTLTFAYTDISSITVPEGIEALYGAFSYSTKLKVIKLPSSLKFIDDSTFSWANSLSDIYYADSPERFDEINQSNNIHATIHYNAVGTSPPKIIGIAQSSDNIEISLADVEYDSDLITIFSNSSGMVDFEQTNISAGDMSKATVIPEGTEKVKAFIWNSLSDMRPLCEAKTVEIQ